DTRCAAGNCFPDRYLLDGYRASPSAQAEPWPRLSDIWPGSLSVPCSMRNCLDTGIKIQHIDASSILMGAEMAVKLRVVEGASAAVLVPVRGGRRSNKDLGRERRHLTPDEVERLEKAVKRNRNATRDWLLIHMAARHGFRASEIVGLKRSAIDLDK